jgi:hypothetical protein
LPAWNNRTTRSGSREDTGTSSLENTLNERGQQYGNFSNQAEIAQKLKGVVYAEEGYERLSSAHREALDIILHKISRIINGNPNYVDNWHDIAGYATLIQQIIENDESGG